MSLPKTCSTVDTTTEGRTMTAHEHDPWYVQNLHESRRDTRWLAQQIVSSIDAEHWNPGAAEPLLALRGDALALAESGDHLLPAGAGRAEGGCDTGGAAR